MAITLTSGWITPEQKIEFLKHLGTITINTDPRESTRGKFLLLAIERDKFLLPYIRKTNIGGWWVRLEQIKFITEVDEAKYYLSSPEGYYI